MYIYQKYIFKLLLSRFTILLFCVSLFGIFQEITKGELLQMCSFWQTVLILPMTLPFIVFQFLPFIYVGCLLLVLNEIYNNNELIGVKTVGISNFQLFKVFLTFLMLVLFFFVILGFVYPVGNRMFYQQRDKFSATNVLKMLQPNKINIVGNHGVFFTNIDSNNILHNITIVEYNKNVKKNETHLKTKNIFSKNMTIGYNQFHELVARCFNSTISNIDTTNTDGVKQIEVQQVVNSDVMDVLFSEFFHVKTHVDLKYKHQLRQLPTAVLLKTKTLLSKERFLLALEIHGRVVVYWFMLSAITCVLGVLLIRQTNRVPSFKITIFSVLLGFCLALSRAFFLESLIGSKMLIIFYCAFIVIVVCCVVFLRNSDRT